MKRLLCIVGSMDVGGAETFLMKLYRSLDKEKYQIDFCVGKEEKGFYDDEIIAMGGRIYRITPKTKNAWRNFIDVQRIVRNNRYNNVMRTSQNSLSSIELLAARLGGAKKIIFRSSNSSVYGGKMEKLVHRLFRPFANLISNIKIAPSKESGKFMFGKHKFSIVKNGLPINEYRFSQKNRNQIRGELGVDKDTIVIGHVGRFNKQKNHEFLVDVFDEYHRRNENSVLWLVGEGDLRENIKKYIVNKGLNECVRILDPRKDINRIYSGMDCFVFPSLFEGMPNAIIEAQASGLPCIASDTITRECDMTGNVKFLSLANASDWVENIFVCSDKSRALNYISKEYDIDIVTKDLTKLLYDDEVEDAL